MVVTGGGKWNKVEFSSLDLWVMVTIFLSYSYYKVTGRLPRLYIKVKLLVRRLRGAPSSTRIVQAFFLLALYFIVLNVFKVLSLQTHGYDMAYVHRGLYHPYVNEKWLFCEICKNQTYFGDHLSFVFVPLSYLFSLFKSEILIESFKVISIFLGLFILFKAFILEGKSKALKFFFPTLFIILCNRSLRNSLLWNFREDHLLFLFLSIMIFGIVRRKNLLVFLGAILGLITKEQVGLIIMATAPVYFYYLEGPWKKRLFYSFTLFLCGGVYFAVAMKLLIPFFAEAAHESNNIVGRFSKFGSTPQEIIYNVITTPKYILEITLSLVNKMNVKYLFLMIAPYVFFLRRGAIWLVPASVTLMLNMISPLPNEKMMIFHYDLPALPFLITALFVGLSKAKVNNSSLIWACIIGLSFSGRWPLAGVKFPRLDLVQTSLRLNSLPHNYNYASSIKNLAKILSVKSAIPIDFKSCKDKACIVKMLNRNRIDRVILDLREEREALFYEIIKNQFKSIEIGNQIIQVNITNE